MPSTKGASRATSPATRSPEALKDVELTPDQIDGIYNLFADLGIDILEGEGAAAADGPDAKVEEEVIPKLDLSVRRSPTTRCACTSRRSARCRC